MNKTTNRDINHMYDMWETDKLEGSNHRVHEAGMLREITEDDMTPKKHNFLIQNEIHEKIRNDEDYDDWSYGTEPLPLREWK